VQVTCITHTYHSSAQGGLSPICHPFVYHPAYISYPVLREILDSRPTSKLNHRVFQQILHHLVCPKLMSITIASVLLYGFKAKPCAKTAAEKGGPNWPRGCEPSLFGRRPRREAHSTITAKQSVIGLVLVKHLSRMQNFVKIEALY
jgi:hypothetical protein